MRCFDMLLQVLRSHCYISSNCMHVLFLYEDSIITRMLRNIQVSKLNVKIWKPNFENAATFLLMLQTNQS